MNGFLLLRDNKQTGPYTISELRNMGLKSYDLIWQEGKSAAWKYPGEISDLADFAPPVLEQPYDRFFKKPEKEKVSIERPEPVKLPEAETLSSKVFVAMPAQTIENVPKRKDVPSPEPKGETIPVIKSKPAEYVKINVPVQTLPGTSQPVLTENTNMSDRTYNYLMKSIFAICLILIGFIVAIYISDLRSGAGLPPETDIVMDNNSSGMEASFLPIETEEENVNNLPPGPPAIIPSKKHNIKKQPVANTVIPVSTIEELPEEIIPAPLSADELANLKREIMGKISLETNADYKVSPFGGVDELKVILSNNSNNALNKVDIKINFYNQNRKAVRSQVLNLRNVGAGEVKEISVPKSSRGVEFSVELVAVDPVL